MTVLNHTLLVRHPKTRKFLVNFDPKITEVIWETKCLLSMGLEVPKQALALLNMERKLQDSHLRLKVKYIFSFFTTVVKQGL